MLKSNQDISNDSQQHVIYATEMYTELIALTYQCCPAVLRSNSIENPTNLKLELPNAALRTPDLRNFFQSKYKWSTTTINTIDLQVDSTALNQQHPYSKKAITQFIHCWLLNHRHHGTKKDITIKCLVCHLH